MTVPRTQTAVVPASIGRRIGAYAIDVALGYGVVAVLAGIFMAVVFGIGSGWTLEALTIALTLAYLGIGLVTIVWWVVVYTLMQGGRGSFGQRWLGLRLVQLETGGRIGYWRALLRNVIWNLAGSIVVGYFSPLFDKSGRHQGWHDMVVSAVVVDGKAMDAAASAVAPAPAPPTANPYLPPPTSPSLVAAPSAGLTPAALPAPVEPPVSPRAFQSSFVAASSATGMISHVPGVTQDAPRPAPAAPVAAPQAAPEPAPAVYATTPYSATATTTPLDDDLETTRIASAAQQAAHVTQTPALAVLTWDDGARMAVYGTTLYGRNPAAQDGAAAVAVRDETLSLSKTHFEISGSAGDVWVTDRHSTNGTTLVRDGGRHPLAPGQQTSLRPGDRLEFGDRAVTVGAP